MSVFQVFLSWTALFLLFLIFISFLGYCIYVKHIHMKYDHIPGPPRHSFLFGHSATVMRAMRNEEVIYETFLEWAEKYGPVCRVNLLHYVLILVTCPEATKEILMSPKYPKDRYFYHKFFSLFGQRFLGSGLLTATNHEQWYKQRRVMQPAFSSLYLRGLTGTFNERAEKLMAELTVVADNQTEVKMLHLISTVTLDVIAKVAFGVEIDLAKDSPFPKAIVVCLKAMIWCARDHFFEFRPRNRPFIKEVREACRLLRRTGAQWINDRKTAMQNGNDVPKDILTQIIKSADKEENSTKEDEELMLDNFVSFFVAGQETTANQLAFCILELTRQPVILEKVRKEVDDVIGMKQEISYNDLGQLIYLSQVLKEILRLYPPAPATPREILEDMVIDGIHIPANITCILSTYVTGRMDKFFKDPLTFDPDRFQPDAPKPYYCYYPFALGPRACLGQTFAQLEAKVVMAKLLQRFDFTLVPGQTFDLQDNGTIKPKSGVVCSVRHRK